MSVSIPDGLVVLTFDDGVKSQHTFAAPILRECGFNATFYITEGLNFLTDKTRYLTWEEVRELHDMGFEIGNHTRQHKSVANQSGEELLSDIRHIDRQCNHYGIPIPTTFCYPGYTNTLEAVEVIKERGFTYARRGTAPEYPYHREGGRGPAYNPVQHDPLLIPTTGASGPLWNFDDFLWSLDLAQNGCATVLTFHGVPDLDHPWVHTEPAFFERCMQHLTDNGHRVIALRDLTNYIAMEPDMVDPLPLIAYDTLAEQTEALYRDGYAYLPGVLTPDQVTKLRDHMDALTPIPESFDKNGLPEDIGFINKHINNAFNRHPHFLQFLDSSGVIEIAEAIHGDDCHCIGMTAWLTGPGRPDQNLHIDWLPLSLPADILEDSRVRVPIFITTAHFYLDDITEALGPTNFIPGSHLSGRSPNGEITWKGQTEKSIMCNAGDVVIFRSEVWHRGTANTSDKTRYLLQVHYAKRMITQKYPPYLNRFQFGPEILDQATPRQRRLMGDHKSSNYD